MTTSGLILRALFGALFLFQLVVAGLALLTVRRGPKPVGATGETGSSGVLPNEASPWSPLDLFTASTLLGVAVTTVCGLALAYLGVFNAGTVALTVAAVTALVCFGRGRAYFTLPPLRRPGAAELLAAAVAAGILIYGGAFRFHEVAGGRDPGVYINTGIELSRTGTLGWVDPAIDRYGFYGTRHLMEDIGLKVDEKPRWLRFAGYYLPNPKDGQVEPQFLHGYEVWVALAYSFGGVQATQILNSAFVALALLAVFGSIHAVTASRAAAVFAVILLAASPAELWFARSPGNEMMIQALLWGFLLLYGRALGAGEKEGAYSFPPQRRLVAGALALIGTATLVKIAAWLLLPAVAFDMGFQRTLGRLRVRGRSIWLALVLLALGAFVHARLFAAVYYYGSWKFTAGERGVSYVLFPILFVGGTAAAFSLGMITAPAIAALGRRTHGSRTGYGLAAAVVLLLAGAWLFQERLLSAGIPAKQIWSEATNVAEFVFYFGPVPFLLGAAGLALIAVRRPTPAAGIFLLLLLGSSALLIQRNLDALHPWAARRWMPFLIPAWSVGMAYLLAVIWRGQPALPRRAAAAAGFAATLALLVGNAPQLITSRNFFGAVPALDRLAAHMKPDDLVLTQPTGALMRWAPYMKARFDVDWYKHPFLAETWADSRMVLRAAAGEGRRVLLLSDAPLTMTAALRKSLIPIHEELLTFTQLPDGIRRIEPAAAATSQTITVYQLRAAELPRGWWPGAVEELPGKPPARPLPLELTMGKDAEPYLENFHPPTEAAPGVSFRWTNGNGRVYLGELLDGAQLRGRGPLTITARLASARPELGKPLQVHWIVDLGLKGRERQIAVTPINADWTEVSLKLDPSLIRPDSFLQLVSERPPVQNLHPGGQLGHMVMSIRIE